MRLLASGTNEISGVSTAVKLSSVNCDGTLADSVADGSNEASSSQASGTAKQIAMTISTAFETAFMLRPLGEVMPMVSRPPVSGP